MNKNIFKRLFIALGIVITLCLMVLPVKAAGLTATTSSVSGSKGDSVTITVTLSEKVNVISGAISFEYDKKFTGLTDLVGEEHPFVVRRIQVWQMKGEFNNNKQTRPAEYYFPLLNIS